MHAHLCCPTVMHSAYTVSQLIYISSTFFFLPSFLLSVYRVLLCSTMMKSTESKRKANEPAVAVPSNLDTLDKAELLSLIQALDAERSCKKAKTTAAATASAPAAPATPPFGAKAVERMKTTLTKKAVAAVKMAKVSTRTNKPWVEIQEGLSLEQSKVLIGEHGDVSKDTKSAYVKALTSADLHKFLPDIPYAIQAKWTGKSWGMVKSKSAKTTVKFEQAEFKYDKKASVLILRLRIGCNY